MAVPKIVSIFASSMLQIGWINKSSFKGESLLDMSPIVLAATKTSGLFF
nr:MAG TPA: hypothetical protein [Caudoviricetes sp.]